MVMVKELELDNQLIRCSRCFLSLRHHQEQEPIAGARDEAGGGGVEQYHAECNSVDAVTCVPACNAGHHGFELLATIDGSDTKFSCNLAHGLFSWMGAASMGIYLGDDFASFFSSVISGAAG